MRSIPEFFHWRSFLLLSLLSSGMALTGSAQQKDPWQVNQLLDPSVLVQQLNLPESQRPVVIDVGPAGVIRYAAVTGPTHEKDGIKNLAQMLQKIPKEKEVVIYCGCCPFDKCPNVRPAFKMLLDMGFKDPRLLNLPHNLKADWIDQGYPLADQ
jgi:hypothetical protein